jgi:hypothetical protein
MIKFDCKGRLNNKEKTWRGYITKLIYYGCHMEISIMLDDPITIDVCKTASGFIVFFERYECASALTSLFGIDDNISRLLGIFDGKDATTVAYAIAKVGNLLSNPRRRRKPANIPMSEVPF